VLEYNVILKISSTLGLIFKGFYSSIVSNRK
jgi:hypothetical protein